MPRTMGSATWCTLIEPGWTRHPLLEAAIERMGVPEGHCHPGDDLLGSAQRRLDRHVGRRLRGAGRGAGPADAGAPERPRGGLHRARRSRWRCWGSSLGFRISSARPMAASTTSRCSSTRMPRSPQSACRMRPGGSWNGGWRSSFWEGLTIRVQVHERVIRSLEDAGPDCKELADLRATAGPVARRRLCRGFRGVGAGDDRQH